LSDNKLSKEQFLQVRPLRSIKTQIIVFALLATIIPSVTMGWLSYIQNREFLNEKIKQELRVATNQVSRELDLWLKDRLYDLRVFSSSYVVLENLEKILREGSAHLENVVAHRRLKDYLGSVREKIVDYQELMILDLQAAVVATSSDKLTTVKLPERWLERAQANKYSVGSAYWDEILQAAVIVIAQPIRTTNEQLVGVLVAKLNFHTISRILMKYARGEIGELYLITQDGFLLVSSHSISAEFLKTKMLHNTTQRLFSQEGEPHAYLSYHNQPVVGALKRISELGWGVVAEKQRAKAYAQIVRLRNLTLALVVALLFLIGLTAYFLSLSLVRPINRLTSGAGKVASGDLDVDVPVGSRSEVGYLTEVFNDMVARLRQGREELASINETLRQKNVELHEISITDSLTRLYNRKHLMETLDREVTRSERYSHPFSLLIIDIDHFKKYNDTYGHLAGDEVLRRLASVFKETIRSSDYAARYGGEEFIIILPEISPEQGVEAAERIRRKVAEQRFEGDGEAIEVTISVGVASYPENGEDAETVIRNADEALYEAKKLGRNQVTLADANRKKKKKKKSKAS
jgi:diguanylate cyclase (GGDEF)-like protein